MENVIGRYQQQPSGYKAFIPLPFPPVPPVIFSKSIEEKHAKAMHLVGKLDGVTQLLPDKDFFLLMFVKKEAASSSQIEGTQATMADAIESEVVCRPEAPKDISDIIHYVKALNYGMQRFQTLPLSIRFICEMHSELMKDGRATQNPFPGEIRRTQNWIHGTSPSNARYVPPPAHEILRALGDLEKFIHNKDFSYPPLIKAALLHAQFETIHPFVDGNGRTGRLLVTMYLFHEKLLEIPLLYFSDFFKKHQELYYKLLQTYHGENSEIDEWVDFFLEAVIETAESSIKIAYQINQIREKDMAKIHALGKSAAASSVEILRKLFTQPIVDVAKVQEWTGFTRAGAQRVIDRFIGLGILIHRDPEKTYGRIYEYHSYLSLFQKEF